MTIDESVLAELVLQWEQSQASGNPPSVEHVCRDHPELVGPLRQRIEELSWVDQLLDLELDQGHEFRQGDHIGRYRLEEHLGEGGFGQVWRAHDPELGRDVALKLLHPYRLPIRRDLENVVNEARNLARLRHANIVTIFDTGRDWGSVYLVTELVQGTSLSSALKDGPLNCAQALSIAREIGNALQHAHEAGIIHRDVKPANILMDAEGHAFLTDFGIAFADDTGTTLTDVVGTPGYMAPEQAGLLDRPVGPACDVYALGRVLIAMLTGFTGANEKLPPSRRECREAVERSQLPDNLRGICLKATAWLPEERYSSAAELVERVEKAMASMSRSRWRCLFGIVCIAAATIGAMVLAHRNLCFRHTLQTHDCAASLTPDKYLHVTKNAILNNETPYSDVWYWAPAEVNKWAEIVFRYDLPFAVHTAAVHANINSFYVNFDPGAKAYLDVSADGEHWTTVAERHTERNPAPFDVSDILRGSHTAFIRGRLYETKHFGSVHYAQFLRTTNDRALQSEHVYQFRAQAVDAPNVWVGLVGCCTFSICFGLWRWRRK